LALAVLVAGCGKPPPASKAPERDSLLEYSRLLDAIRIPVNQEATSGTVLGIVKQRQHLTTQLLLAEVLLGATNGHEDVDIVNAGTLLFGETNLTVASLVEKRRGLLLALSAVENVEYKLWSAQLQSVARTKEWQDNLQHSKPLTNETTQTRVAPALLTVPSDALVQASEINALGAMRERYDALVLHSEAVTSAQHKWLARSMHVARQRGDVTDQDVFVKSIKVPDRYQGFGLDATPLGLLKAVHDALAARQIELMTEAMLLEGQLAKLTNQPPKAVERVSALTTETASTVSSTVKTALTEQASASRQSNRISTNAPHN